MLYQKNYQSPLGSLKLLSDETALLGVWFTDQKYFGAGYDLRTARLADTAILHATQQWLTAYFAGQRPAIDTLTLAPEVTAYRQKVLEILCEIPYGQTWTYQDIAEKLGHSSPRAVGGAVGHNPISIIIPCHRVIGRDGQLTGYAGGMDRKVALLKLEGVLKA